MRAVLLSLAILAAPIMAGAQEIETPFGGVHGPFVRDHSERWDVHRHWHPGGGHWDSDNWRWRRHHEYRRWRHYHHDWDDDDD